MGKQKEGWPGTSRPGTPPVWQKSQESKSFVLRTYVVHGMGVKMSYWLMGKGGASFPGGMCLPKCSYVWGSVSPNPHLAPDSTCSFCIRDRRQAINEVVLWGISLDAVDPSPSPFQALGWIPSLKVSFFQLVEMMHTDFHGPPFLLHCHSCASCSEHLAALSNQAQDCWVDGWDMPPSSSLPWFAVCPT